MASGGHHEAAAINWLRLVLERERALRERERERERALREREEDDMCGKRKSLEISG